MTQGEARAHFRHSGETGEFLLSEHARQRMRERSVSVADVVHGLKKANACRYQTDKQSWEIKTRDIDDEPLTIIAAIEQGTVIVTVIRPGL